MGLKVGGVRLEKHNPRWHRMFAQELDELWEYFGDTAIRISHIGSTAVDGLEAKPIIDIVVALNDLNDFDEVSHRFTSDPNYSIKEGFSNDEILIRKGPKGDRHFYIHVMDIDSKRYRDVIFFRDILLHNEKVHNNYRDLKHVLAKKYAHSRKKYSASKADFIDNTLEMEWARTTLVPMAIIAGITLSAFVASLYVALTVPADTKIFDVYVLGICRVGLALSGAFFIFSAITVGVLLCRFFKAKSIYNAVVARTQKEIAKESPRRQ